MLHLLDIPFELRAPEGLVGPTAEAKQAPFLRLNPLGQVCCVTYVCTMTHQSICGGGLCLALVAQSQVILAKAWPSSIRPNAVPQQRHPCTPSSPLHSYIPPKNQRSGRSCSHASICGPKHLHHCHAHLCALPPCQVPVLVDPNMEPEPAVGHGGNAGEPHCAEGLVIRESAAILVSSGWMGSQNESSTHAMLQSYICLKNATRLES